MTPQTTPMDEQEISLRDLMDVVSRRWWVVAACGALALAAALTVSLTTPPVYRASTTVVVDSADSAIRFVPDVTGISQQALVDAVAEVAKSRAVAELALDRLGVNENREEALRSLQAGLKVHRVRGGIIRIDAQGSSPRDAAANANAAAQGIVDWNLQWRRAQAAAGRAFIEAQLALMGTELRHAENALAARKARGVQISLSEQTSIVINKLADFEAQRRATAAEREAIEASLLQAGAALATQQPTVPSSFVRAEDPVVAGLRQELTRLEIDLAGLREQFTDRHPQIVATQARITEVKARLRQLAAERVASTTVTLNPLRQSLASQIIALEVEREAARAKEAALGNIVARYTREAQTVPSREVELAGLARSARVAEQTYLLLSEKLQEAKIVEASIVGDLRVIDRAVPPIVPVSPRTRMNTLLGSLLGVMVGGVVAYLLEALDTTMKTPEEAEQVLGLPILASVPQWHGPSRKETEAEASLATNSHPRTPFAEAFRRLRTNLVFLSPDRPLRTVLITSPGAEEGKSTVAANLAIALSQAGRRVWLIECDLRRPRLSWVFQPRTAIGLSEMLVDGVPVEEFLHPTQVENLWFVPSGMKPPNPAELLGSQKMRSLLSGQTDAAEFVILDAAPVLPVADAAILAPAADGVILVVKLKETPRDAARQARQALEAVGARVVGVVILGVPPNHRSHYYYYSSYYQDVEGSKRRVPTAGSRT